MDDICDGRFVATSCSGGRGCPGVVWIHKQKLCLGDSPLLRNSLWRMLKLGKVSAIEYVVGFLRAPSIGISVTDADHSEIMIRTSLVSYYKEREMVGFR